MTCVLVLTWQALVQEPPGKQPVTFGAQYGTRSYFASETLKLPKNCYPVQLSHLQSKNAIRGFFMVTILSRGSEVLPKVPVLQGASTGESRPIQPKDCNLLPRAQGEKHVPAHAAQAFHVV